MLSHALLLILRSKQQVPIYTFSTYFKYLWMKNTKNKQCLRFVLNYLKVQWNKIAQTEQNKAEWLLLLLFVYWLVGFFVFLGGRDGGFETWSFWVTVLIVLYTRSSWNSQRSTCPCLLSSAGINSIHQHHRAEFCILGFNILFCF